jgi:hypothetical protein
MSLIYIVELVYSNDDICDLLGKFESLANSFDYIIKYSSHYDYKIITNYNLLSHDQHRGSVIAVNNIKKPSKVIYIRSEINKRRKLTM